jgi:hypothetical protein
MMVSFVREKRRVRSWQRKRIGIIQAGYAFKNSALFAAAGKKTKPIDKLV